MTAKEFIGSRHTCANCKRERSLSDWVNSYGTRCCSCRTYLRRNGCEHPLPIGRQAKPPGPCAECGYVTKLRAGYCGACYERRRQQRLTA